MKLIHFCLLGVFVFSLSTHAADKGKDENVMESPTQKLYLARIYEKEPSVFAYKDRYFHKNSILYSGIEEQKVLVHNEKLLGSPLNKRLIIEKLYEHDQYKSFTSFNHLICNIFCIASLNEKDSPLFILESPIFAKEQEDFMGRGYYYDFSIKKPYIITNEETITPFYRNNGKLLADFVSSNPDNEQLGFITKQKLIPIIKDHVRKPIINSAPNLPLFVHQENADHHGDQVALYTLRTNKHLFLKLITKNGHRSNYRITAFGCRYFSVYDACEACNDKIFQTKDILREGLRSILQEEEYNNSYQNKPIPFYNLFYSSLPYHGDNGGPSKYSLVTSENKVPYRDLTYRSKDNKLISTSNNSEIFSLQMFQQQEMFNESLASDWIYSNIEKFNVNSDSLFKKQVATSSHGVPFTLQS